MTTAVIRGLTYGLAVIGLFHVFSLMSGGDILCTIGSHPQQSAVILQPQK
jgi:hypothetical protein